MIYVVRHRWEDHSEWGYRYIFDTSREDPDRVMKGLQTGITRWTRTISSARAFWKEDAEKFHEELCEAAYNLYKRSGNPQVLVQRSSKVVHWAKAWEDHEMLIMERRLTGKEDVPKSQYAEAAQPVRLFGGK